MAKLKRKIAFSKVCEYCEKSFKTSMPFAKFCCPNHRKYFDNKKKKMLIVSLKKSVLKLEKKMNLTIIELELIIFSLKKTFNDGRRQLKNNPLGNTYKRLLKQKQRNITKTIDKITFFLR